MHHFHCKLLAVYCVAVSSVLLLFQSVTLFGDRQLQASPKISDRYRLLMAKNLANCEKSPDLILNLQQSGIYVNASVSSTNYNTTISAINSHQNSFTGILRNQQLQLSGKIDSSILCPINPTRLAGVYSANMRMQFRDNRRFTGQLIINNVSPNLLKFTAVPNYQSPLNSKTNE
jgi:hypothetical protein